MHTLDLLGRQPLDEQDSGDDRRGAASDFTGIIKPSYGAVDIWNNAEATILNVKAQGAMFGSPDETLVVSGNVGGKPFVGSGVTTFTGDVVVSGNLYSSVEVGFGSGVGEMDIKDQKFILSVPGAVATKSVVLPSLSALPGLSTGGLGAFQGWQVTIIHVGTGQTAITTDDPSAEFFLSSSVGPTGTQIVLEASSNSVTLMGCSTTWYQIGHTN